HREGTHCRRLRQAALQRLPFVAAVGHAKETGMHLAAAPRFAGETEIEKRSVGCHEMAHPCPYAELSPSMLVAPPVSRRGSAKSSQLGRKTATDQKALPAMAITKPAVPPHKVQTRISRRSARPALQSRLLRCLGEAAGSDVQRGMAHLPV